MSTLVIFTLETQGVCIGLRNNFLIPYFNRGKEVGVISVYYGIFRLNEETTQYRLAICFKNLIEIFFHVT